MKLYDIIIITICSDVVEEEDGLELRNLVFLKEVDQLEASSFRSGNRFVQIFMQKLLVAAHSREWSTGKF